MEELVKQVSERTGLGEDKARQAVETVVNFLKARLPGPLAGQVDSVLANPQASDAIGSVADKLGGLFGGE